MAKPIVSPRLWEWSLLGLVLILGFNFFSLISVVLLGLGALLGFLGASEAGEKPTRKD
jgi:hypothetical protein